MKKPILTLFITLLSFGLNAQTQSVVLNQTNSNVTILNGGDFFWDLSTSKYEVPKSTGGALPKSTIFSGSIWMGGIDIGQNLHLAAMTYRQRGKDFKPGPVSYDTSSSGVNYDVIYKVTKSQIDAHISNPSAASGTILDWPAHGDTSKGEPYQLAPFIDINSNGKYEPLLGDYPKIKGTAAAYCVYNDRVLHTESFGEPINIEVHQMFYQDAFNHNGTLIDDVNLASFTIINKGFSALSDFVFGIYTDFDLGNFADDFVGSDSDRNMVYVYNGDDNDEGVLGYGLNPPAQNMMFLNHPLGSAMSYDNSANPHTGNPSIANDYYNYLNARFKNGNPLTDTSGNTTRFAYSGDPVSETGWIEKNTNTAGDRRMLAGSQPFRLEPNQPVCFDIAYVYGRATSGGAAASIDVMRAKADMVQSVYDNNTYGWKTTTCQLGAHEKEVGAGIFSDFQKANFSIYPNPSTGLFNIKEIQFDKPSYITDISGKIIKILDARTTQFDLQDFETGVYFLRTEFGSVRLLKL